MQAASSHNPFLHNPSLHNPSLHNPSFHTDRKRRSSKQKPFPPSYASVLGCSQLLSFGASLVMLSYLVGLLHLGWHPRLGCEVQRGDIL